MCQRSGIAKTAQTDALAVAGVLLLRCKLSWARDCMCVCMYVCVCVCVSQGVYVKLFCESESGEVTGCLRTSTVSTNTRAPSWEVTPNESMLTIYQPDSNLVVEVWTETSGVDGTSRVKCVFR